MTRDPGLVVLHWPPRNMAGFGFRCCALGGNPMSAAEVIALHTICQCGEWAENIEEQAAHVIAALKAAGYAVVQLSGNAGMENYGLRATPGRVHDDFDGYTHSPAKARSLAAALLSAAEAAEANA